MRWSDIARDDIAAASWRDRAARHAVQEHPPGGAEPDRHGVRTPRSAPATEVETATRGAGSASRPARSRRRPAM